MVGSITAEEFSERLAALCTGGALKALPRRERDTAIVLASAAMWMEDGAVYTESEVNAGLARWLGSVCPALGLDVVTLRRELIDRRFLDRDDAGRHYTAGSGPSTFSFDPAIGVIDPVTVIEAASNRRAERKREHLARQEKE